MEADQETSDGKVSLFVIPSKLEVSELESESECLTLSLASVYIASGERLLVW